MKAELYFITEENLINNYTSKWLEFIIFGKTEKTVRIKVRNKKDNITIGTISWYSPFRKYCFEPFPSTFYEHVCLSDIVTILTELDVIRKRRNQNGK